MLLKEIDDSRGRLNFGRLHSAILVGITTMGTAFSTALERQGILLCDDMPPTKFSTFLSHLKARLFATQHPDWNRLADRVQTYIVYQEFSAMVQSDELRVHRLLRLRPRLLIKKVLAVADVMFLRSHFGFELLGELNEWLEDLGSPEDVASVASILVARANEFHRLDSLDLGIPAIGELATSEMRFLMSYGKSLMHLNEIAKHISLFGYRLENVVSSRGPVFCLKPPSSQFEYAMRLGFVRAEMSWAKIPANLGTHGTVPRFSLLAAAEMFANKTRNAVCEIKDDGTPFRRLRVNFPMEPHLYAPIMKSVLYDDLAYRERLNQDYLFLLDYENENEVQLTDKLDLGTFKQIWRHLQFLSLVDIALLREYEKRDSTILTNSLIRVLTEQNMIALITSMGATEAHALEFLRLVSADVHHLGYLDLQYRPLLRIAANIVPGTKEITPKEIVYVPALLCVSNALRNVQSANKIRLRFNASVFVEVVAKILRSRFPLVTTNREVATQDRKTDIDVAVLHDAVLYIFECKHSVPPTGPHEMRDLWEEIEAGTHQLHTAMEVFKDRERLLSYLAGWFKGTNRKQLKNLVVRPCVLCSHRIFSGMVYNNVPVRDVASLAKLLDDGVVSIGRVDRNGESVSFRYRITPEGGFSAVELDDYLSDSSKYFNMFVPFMHPLSRFERIGNVTIARETYAYEVDSDDWMRHMESLGFTREADEHPTLQYPWSSDELLEKLNTRPDKGEL